MKKVNIHMLYIYQPRKMLLASQNQFTIESYHLGARSYVLNTPQTYTSDDFKPLVRWLDTALAMLKPNAHIFEVGSAIPREANYIKSKGFSITCSDVAPALIDNLKASGHKTVRFNALEDEVPGKFDMILANAVVPHFTPDEFDTALAAFRDGLSVNGIIGLSVKEGEGEEWIREKNMPKRFIHYWQPDNLLRFIEERGFKITYLQDKIQGNLPNHTFIHIIARKVC